jgi:hypothetical protein
MLGQIMEKVRLDVEFHFDVCQAMDRVVISTGTNVAFISQIFWSFFTYDIKKYSIQFTSLTINYDTVKPR